MSVEAGDPSLEVTKTEDISGFSTPIAVGDQIGYEITVENTGNISITDLVLTDTTTNLSGDVLTLSPDVTYQPGDTNADDVLDVGETWTYTTTLTLTQDDIDSGRIINTITVDGSTDNDGPVSDTSDDGNDADGNTEDDPTETTLPATPSISAIKTITSSTVAVGETVTFEIAVTNTGNVTLTGVAIASDVLTNGDGEILALTGPSWLSANMGSGSGTLQVGETAIYAASYILTQDDVDSGSISNTAQVTGTPPNGPAVTDTTDDDTAGSADDPTVLTIPADPAITIAKALAAGSIVSFDSVGQTVDFEFTVTNTGNVTLTDQISIVDPLITDAGGSISCPLPPLAVGVSMVCEGSYGVTQDDIDAGGITNVATATDGTTETDPLLPGTVTVPAVQNPAMELVKTNNPAISPAQFVDGAVVTYDYVVTNTGNTTLMDPITVSDNLIASVSCPAFPADGLAPTEPYTCSASYTVTANDVILGSVTNTAQASSGGTDSNIADETVPAGAVPALSVVKSVDPAASFENPDDPIVFTFEITNTGNGSFGQAITINDSLIPDPILCWEPNDASGNGSTFDPDPAWVDAVAGPFDGETTSCTATYPATQDDIDAGEIVNEASATTTFAGTTVVTSAVSTASVTGVEDPEITLTKSATTLPITAVGQVLTYTLSVENTGNQTLFVVSITDPLIPSLSCTIAQLDVGATDSSCTGTYTLQQSDIDGPNLTNTAQVRATDPMGDLLEDNDTLVLAVPAPMPSVEIEKSVAPSPFGGVGSAIDYRFTVTNTGNVTLDNLIVTDALDPTYSCNVPDLAPMQSDNSCVFLWTITQDHVDAGEIDNTARIDGTDPFGTTVFDQDAVNSRGPAENPALEVTKTASTTGTQVGDVVTYTVRIENTGNVTLIAPTLSDRMTLKDGAATQVSLDAPGLVLQSGDNNADTRLDVDETWVYTGTYTITQATINAGGVDNTVDAVTASMRGTPVNDTSDDGDDSDGNSTDDPTVFEIIQAPAVETVKTVLPIVNPVAGSEVTFEIALQNIGNVSLTDVQISDTITRIDGQPATGVTTDPTFDRGNSAPMDFFDPSETWVFLVTYTLTQEDIDAGGVENTATGSAQEIQGTERYSDVSDDGIDRDGNLTNDPTQFLITPLPALDVLKEVTTTGSAAGEIVSFRITYTNTGNVMLRDIRLVDTLTNLDGDVLTPASIVSSTPANGDLATDGTLPVGGEAFYDVTYELAQDDVDAGGIENTATVFAAPPIGPDVFDVSRDDDPADGNDVDDSTQLLIAPDGRVDITKTADTPARLSATQFSIDYEITVEILGNVSQTGITMTDDLTAMATPATLVSVTEPVVIGLNQGSVNAGFDGAFDINLLSSDAKFSPGTDLTVTYTVVIDTATGAPNGVNTVNYDSDIASAPVSDSASITVAGEPEIFATKSVSPTTAIRGDTLSYTLTFTNPLNVVESGLTLVDALPSGLIYTDGSALYDGAATPEPVYVNGRLEWRNVDIAPNSTVTITFDANLTGGAGTYVNRAYALGAVGTRVSNIATAETRVAPEHVFDCSDVIGTVFDDRNSNGYQDGPQLAPIIDDDALFNDKLGKLIAPEAIDRDDYDGEPGLPQAKVVTQDGTVSTTDEFGRYSVPCAAFPASIGSNFTLKLDTRSLPTGYRVTTQNPRTIRVTPGKMAKLNFGASVSKVVDLDLSAAAFGADNAATPAVVSALVNAIERVHTQPVVVRLTYVSRGESRQTAARRLDAIEDILKTTWHDIFNSPHQLTVERTISRLQ